MKIKKRTQKLPIQPTDEEINSLFKALEEPEDIEITDADIVHEPQPLKLTKDELLHLQLTQFQTRAYEAELRLEMLKRDLYVKQIDPQGQLQQMASFIRGRSDEAAASKAAYMKLVASIEERLSIKLSEYAYNDDNGELQKIDS